MENDLVDVSNATVCVVGVGDCGLATGTNQVSGVTGTTTFTGLIGLVQSKDGWVTSWSSRLTYHRSLSHMALGNEP